MAGESSPSRRSLIRAGFAGLAGLALGALGRPSPAQAAPGGSIVMGSANDAGTTNTSLTTDSDTGTAFQVNQNGTGTALRGVAGSGIAGFFTSANGSGVSGVVAAGNKYGVYGANDSATYGGGAAIRAAGKQNHGILATCDASGAHAVKGTNTAAYGVGIYGVGAGTSGWTSGVYGRTDADNVSSSGVTGMAMAPNGRGVVGQSGYAYTVGVAGIQAASGHGETAVFAAATAATGSCYGLYAQCTSTGGYALYAQGRAYVSDTLAVIGNLTKGSGSFKIDHPLDPANKYLYHSFVESPDMKNVYDGVVTLDAKGEATVELPEWFEALNRDLRYQLTPMDDAAPDLHVGGDLAHGRFRIAGGRAGQRVCWQLTGIRKDPFAEAHRIPVEEAKPEGERGLYLHPVERGVPAEKGLERHRRAHDAPKVALAPEL